MSNCRNKDARNARCSRMFVPFAVSCSSSVSSSRVEKRSEVRSIVSRGDLDSVAMGEQSACVPPRHGRVTRFLPLGWRQPGRATPFRPLIRYYRYYILLHALFLPTSSSASSPLAVTASPPALFTRTARFCHATG